MTEVDYNLLNEQAKLLHDAAYALGEVAGQSATEARMGREHARSMLETIKIMLLGVDQMDDGQRTLWTTRAAASLGKVPLMNVSEEVHRAFDAIRFSRNAWSVSPASIRTAQKAIDDALEKLA